MTIEYSLVVKKRYSRHRTGLLSVYLIGSPIVLSKVEIIWEPALNQEFTGFPAKIWIFKFFFLMVFATVHSVSYTQIVPYRIGPALGEP